MAKANVNIYTYPDIPSYENENVVLIFPSQNAISVSQLISNGLDHDSIKEYQNAALDELPKGYNRSTLMKTIPKSREEHQFGGNSEKLAVTKAVFIDSTWNQSKGR